MILFISSPVTPVYHSKIIIIHKITPPVDYNLWLKCFDTQLNKSANQNSIKVAKVVRPANIKRCCKTLGTRVINSPMSPDLQTWKGADIGM